MPTVPEAEEAELDPVIERIVKNTRQAMGASDRMPMRVLIIFIIVVASVALAPVPANIIGVAAVVLLALDTSLHRR